MSKDGVGARIKAARLLRGMSQSELSRRFAAAGLSGRLVGQLERDEIELRDAHKSTLVEALGFPERWWTDPVDELCLAEPDAGIIERLDEILRLLR